MVRLWLLLSAFAGFSGVAMGAFAAHGLKSRLSADYLAVLQTGTHYQLIHALALLGVAILALIAPGAWSIWRAASSLPASCCSRAAFIC